MKILKEKYSDYMLFESTGKKEYAHCHIIGIDPYLGITYGYDGEFGGIDSYCKEDDLTKEEIIELSDYMIDLWIKFKEKYS